MLARSSIFFSIIFQLITICLAIPIIIENNEKMQYNKRKILIS